MTNIFKEELTFKMTPERRLRDILTNLILVENKQAITLSIETNVIFFYGKIQDVLYIQSPIYNLFEEEFDMTSQQIKDLIRKIFTENVKVGQNKFLFDLTPIKIEF